MRRRTQKALRFYLRTRRIAVGLSQTQLGSRVDRSQQAVANWEAGWSKPEPMVIPALAEVLGVPPMELAKAMSGDYPGA